MTRPMLPYPQLLTLLDEAEVGLAGLLDLLDKAGNAKADCTQLAYLIRPFHQKIAAATNDLHDMKV
ncbi:hypothetical protein CKO37_01510 [Rubrivivax gelatinosus]|nr:hypothetical protein [Rubrivivax gelatinosus]